MKRATLLLAAALIAALSLTSCAHLGISTPQPNQEVPWKDETAAAFGEIAGGSVTSAVTDGGIGVVTRDSRVHGQAFTRTCFAYALFGKDFPYGRSFGEIQLAS